MTVLGLIAVIASIEYPYNGLNYQRFFAIDLILAELSFLVSSPWETMAPAPTWDY